MPSPQKEEDDDLFDASELLDSSETKNYKLDKILAEPSPPRQTETPANLRTHLSWQTDSVSTETKSLSKG